MVLQYLYIIKGWCVLSKMYCFWKHSYQKRRAMFLLTGLNRPHLCACHKAGIGFPTLYVVVSFLVQWVQLRWGCVHFVDIGVINDHHCLNFPFIIECLYKKTLLQCCCCLTVIPWVPLDDQCMLILPEHLISQPPPPICVRFVLINL